MEWKYFQQDKNKKLCVSLLRNTSLVAYITSQLPLKLWTHQTDTTSRASLLSLTLFSRSFHRMPFLTCPQAASTESQLIQSPARQAWTDCCCRDFACVVSLLISQFVRPVTSVCLLQAVSLNIDHYDRT